MCDLLISPIVITAERLSWSRYVYPEAALPADGAGALDLETEDVGGICWGRQVDVA